MKTCDILEDNKLKTSLADMSTNVILHTSYDDANFSEIFDEMKLNHDNLRLEVVLRILSSQSMLRYFKYNPFEYCEFHKHVLLNLKDESQVLDFLKNEYSFRRIVETELFLEHFEGLLGSLLEVGVKYQNDEDVVNEVIKTMRQGVGMHDNTKISMQLTLELLESLSQRLREVPRSRNAKELQCFINDHFGESPCLENHRFSKKLFKQIVGVFHSDGFKIRLLLTALTQNKRSGFNYKLCVILMEMIGFNLRANFGLKKVKYHLKDGSIEVTLQILSEITQVFATLLLDLKETINEVTFSQFLADLLKTVMILTKKPLPYCSNIIKDFMRLDPLLVETNINELIQYFLLNQNPWLEEIFVEIFKIYEKLHRVQNLISKLLPTVRAGLEKYDLGETGYGYKFPLSTEREENADVVFPREVLCYFSNSIINLASWQVINLYKTLLYHLSQAVEELVVNEESKNFPFLNVSSVLLCTVLESVRVAEHSVAGATVEKFVSGLQELRTILGKFGSKMLENEHNPIVMQNFLNISYNWGELFATMEYYSIDGSIKLEKNDTATNLSYIHSYLSCKKWGLIEERINNFGGQPCKDLLTKLIIQKLKSIYLFDGAPTPELLTQSVKHLSSGSSEILCNKFLINNIIEKLPQETIISMGDHLLQRLMCSPTDNLEGLNDSLIVINSILWAIFTKIHRLLRRKRKMGDDSLEKVFYTKVFSTLPSDAFFGGNCEEFYEKIPQVLQQVEESYANPEKILDYLAVLQRLPVVFCGLETQKVVLLLLFALRNSNLRGKSEEVIIGLLQHNGTLLNTFNFKDVLPFILKFERYEALFGFIIQSVCKDEALIGKLQEIVEFFCDNLQEVSCLKCAVLLLQNVQKIKKSKFSQDSKLLSQKFKVKICARLVKVFKKREVEACLVEPFGVVLRTLFAKDEQNLLGEMLGLLDNYLGFALKENVSGRLVLFTSVLHNKSEVPDFNQDIVLRIWNNIGGSFAEENLEEFSQLVSLLAALIPNEEIGEIFKDLLKKTDSCVKFGDGLRDHLKIWSCIVSTNLNPSKTTILREQIEVLLEKLLSALKCTNNSELSDIILQFEVSITQATHVPLTPAILDYFLITVTVLMMKDYETERFTGLFDVLVMLLDSLLKYRNPLIMDRLPPFLLQYRVLLKELCKKGASQEEGLANCAFKLEKLTRDLVECNKDMARISMYLIADILGQYELQSLFPDVKKHLNNCIYSLISLCDQHSIQFLMRSLSNASTEMFKLLYDNYKKYYRFTGKV